MTTGAPPLSPEPDDGCWGFGFEGGLGAGCGVRCPVEAGAFFGRARAAGCGLRRCAGFVVVFVDAAGASDFGACVAAASAAGVPSATAATAFAAGATRA